MVYRAEIDGLRAIAVIAVILYHAGVPGFGGGFVGVDVFFVISGMLIAGLLRDEFWRGCASVRGFIARRLRRLLPMVLVVCIATVLAGWFLLLPGALKNLGQASLMAPIFATNMLYFHEAGYFAAGTGAKPMLHLWSLGVELQFYLGAAILAAVVARRRVARPGLLLALGGAASFGACLWASRAAPDAAFYLLPFRLWEFAVGAAVAGRDAPARHPVTGLVGLAAIGLAVCRFDGGMAWPGVAAVLPVAGTALLLRSGGWVRAGLAAAPLVATGRLSYALYLWHYPVFVFLGLVGVPPLAGLPAVVALALISHMAIERPFCRESAPWRLRAMQGASLALAVVGLALHFSNGVASRLPSPAREVLAQRDGPMPCHDEPLGPQPCRIGDPRAIPTLALIGDSHAGALSGPLGKVLAAQGKAALALTRSWCVPVPGFGTAAPSRGPDCAANMRAAWAAVLADRRIDTVVLAAQWGNATQGARAGLAPVAYGSARVPEENPRAFRHALADFAPRLAASGRRVVILGPVPEYAGSVPERLARIGWRGQLVPERLRAIPDAVRSGSARAALLEFAGAVGGSYLPLRPLFCAKPGARCRVTDGAGKLYYRDASHLSEAGGTVVVRALLDRLLAARSGRLADASD